MTKDWKYIYKEYCDLKDFVRHMHMLQESVFRSASNPIYLHFKKLAEFTTSTPVPRV